MEHFLYIFINSLVKLSNFCDIGCANWRVTNVSLSVRSKEELQKTQDKDEQIVCFDFKITKALYPSLVLVLYLPHF